MYVLDYHNTNQQYIQENIERIFEKSFATGLKRIHTACKEAGCRVEFEQEMDGFVVRFYREKEKPESVNVIGDFQKLQPKLQHGALNEALAYNVLKNIKDNPNITQTELSQITSIPRTSLQRIIKNWVSEGVLIRKGGKRYGHWEVVEKENA